MSASSVPQTMRRFVLAEAGTLDNLRLEEAPVPALRPGEALVRVRAASLNARDLMMIFGPQPYGPKTGIVPLSDAAGEVVAIEGSADVAVGDRVILPFRPGWLDGPLEMASAATDLGGAVDGVAAEYVAMPAAALVPVPGNMSYEQAATLPCAGVTAWSSIHRGAAVGATDTVLVQGTGGVSLFGLQIAKAAGARVIATTSTPEKAERLRALGADAVINYRDTPDWDRTVLELTEGNGVQRIVEIGGAGSLPKSMACIAPEGEIALVGLLDNPMNLISPLPLMRSMAVLRGIAVGSRADLVALADTASRHFEPVIDGIFAFEELKTAITRLASRQHFGKITVRFS